MKLPIEFLRCSEKSISVENTMYNERQISPAAIGGGFHLPPKVQKPHNSFRVKELPTSSIGRRQTLLLAEATYSLTLSTARALICDQHHARSKRSAS